jgi:hypothetical protein
MCISTIIRPATESEEPCLSLASHIRDCDLMARTICRASQRPVCASLRTAADLREGQIALRNSWHSIAAPDGAAVFIYANLWGRTDDGIPL